MRTFLLFIYFYSQFTTSEPKYKRLQNETMYEVAWVKQKENTLRYPPCYVVHVTCHVLTRNTPVRHQSLSQGQKYTFSHRIFVNPSTKPRYAHIFATPQLQTIIFQLSDKNYTTARYQLS